MPFARARRGDVLVVAALCLLAPTLAHALCCDQPGSATMSAAEMNANLVCRRGADPCIIAAQGIQAPPACPVHGCALDFGDRTVTVDGPLTIGTGTLVVRAKTIMLNDTISATGAEVVVDVATTGTCAGSAGDLVIRRPIDVSAATAGLIRLVAGCRLALESGGQLIATSSAGPGGTIDVRAGTSLTQAASLRALGAGNDGGTIALVAGTDLLVQRPIDVHSQGDGEGGNITLRAGALSGDAATGGALTINADLIADGSPDSDGETGEDGGSIVLEAAGPILLANSAALRASGGAPDGAGGTITIGTQAPPTGVLTSLDGDVTLAGPVTLRGASRGDGGDLFATVGRRLTVQGSVDLSAGGDGATGGNMVVTTGGDLRFDGAIVDNGRGSESDGGFVDAKTGIASVATMTVATSLDVRAGPDGVGGDVLLAACRLVVQPNITIDVHSGAPHETITLAASDAMTLGANSRYLAMLRGVTTLVRAPTTSLVIAADAVFNPPAVITVAAADAASFPPCPVCGDGIRQVGEPCDPGVGAEGACCASDCHALVCATPTPSPTTTPSATGLTPTATLSATTTATTTPTASPTATPALPLVQPRAVLACERVLGKGTSRLVATALTLLEACSIDALGCAAVGEPERTACLSRVVQRCQKRSGKLVRARHTFGAAFTKACAGDPPALPFALVRAPEILAFSTIDATCAEDVGLALTSPSAVLACIESGVCAGERALAVAVPRFGEVLPRVLDPASAGLCMTPPAANAAVLLDLQPSRSALHCQRAIVTASRRLLLRQLGVAQRCVDSLLACRLAAGGTARCAPAAERCRDKLAALADAADGTRARLAVTVARACGSLAPAALVMPEGLGFGGVAAACLGLGTPAPHAAEELAPCVSAAYGCAAGAIVRRALPLVDTELARVGLELGAGFACPVATASPTATITPGANSTATASATPTPVSTPNPVTVVIAGGGSTATDCIVEWTVSAPAVDPPPVTSLSCTDGDASCDHDGIPDGVCQFAVGVCLAGTDPHLPDCAPAAGIATYTLESPHPDASNDLDAGNAGALLAVLAELTGSVAGGAGHNTFTFEPALVLEPPHHCTAFATIAVERGGLERRTERFRVRAVSAEAGGAHGPADRDTLLLTCLAPPQ